MNPNQKEKLSCEERSKRKTELQAEQEKLRVEEEAAIAMEEKRKLGAAKQRVETVLVEIPCPEGLVSRCHIPIAAVAQLGLFRILCGVTVTNITYNAPVDIASYLRNVPLYKGDYYPIPGGAGGAHYHTEAVERYNNCSDAGHLDTAIGGPPFTKMDATDVKKWKH